MTRRTCIRTSTWTKLQSPAESGRSSVFTGRRSPAAFVLDSQYESPKQEQKKSESSRPPYRPSGQPRPFPGACPRTGQIRLSNPIQQHQPPARTWCCAQGGVGLTEDRSSFRFFMLGGRAGKVLIANSGSGILRGNFEYGIEIFPFWQAYTPKFERRMCTAPGICSAPYTVGGTFTGVSVTPIQLRWKLHRVRTPQARSLGSGRRRTHLDQPQVSRLRRTSVQRQQRWPGGQIPAYGNFHAPVRCGRTLLPESRTAQSTLEPMRFTSPLHRWGDKNPGVNASIQFSVGYSWWK